MTRTWSAKVVVSGHGMVLIAETPLSEYDLMRDQRDAAIRHASVMCSDNVQVCVDLYKTTKARGVEKDRSFVVFLDRTGKVRYA